MSQYPLCQYLAQLYALLVKAVEIPCEALEHDLILKVGQQRAQALRSQLLADDDTGGTAACEILILVLILFAACESHDLGCHIGAELLLTGASLNHHIAAALVLLKAYKLQRYDIP